MQKITSKNILKPKSLIIILLIFTIFFISQLFILGSANAYKIGNDEIVDSSYTFYIKAVNAAKYDQDPNSYDDLFTIIAVKGEIKQEFSQIEWATTKSTSPIQFKLKNPAGGEDCQVYISKLNNGTSYISTPTEGDGSAGTTIGKCVKINYDNDMRGAAFDPNKTVSFIKPQSIPIIKYEDVTDPKIKEILDGQMDEVREENGQTDCSKEENLGLPACAGRLEEFCAIAENAENPKCKTETTCTDALGVFGWLICEVGDKADFLVNFIEDALYDLLRVPELEVGSDVYQQWGVFRSMATSLLILIGLVAIAAQVFNLDFVSAYTMRKVIPKLIIATIMLFLSYYFLSLAITFVNALGDGVASLIMGPFADGQLLQQSKDGGAIAWILESGNFGAPDSTVAQTAAISMALVAFVTQGGAGLVVIGIMFVLFACLTAFVSLVIRKIMLLGLVMIAPLAIVAWILPSTEKWFKKWWETFSKLLIMYPLIMGLIAIGTVGAYLIAQTGDTMSSIDPNVATNPLASPATIILFAAAFTGGITMLMVLVAYFAPYFFIPSMFKTAGSAFSAISNGLSSKGKQWGKSAAEYSSGGLNKALANKAANGRSYKYTNKLRRKLGREEKVGTAGQRRFYRGLSYVSQGAIIPEAIGGRASRAAAVSKNDKLVQEEKQQLETLVDVRLRGLDETEVIEELKKMASSNDQAIAGAALSQMQKRNMNSELGDLFDNNINARKNIISKQRTDDSYNAYVKEKHKDLHESGWNSDGSVNLPKWQENIQGMRKADVLALNGSAMKRIERGMKDKNGNTINDTMLTNNDRGDLNEALYDIANSLSAFSSADRRTRDAIRSTGRTPTTRAGT